MPGSTRSFEFAKRLARMGHEVVIVTSERSGKKGTKTYEENIEGFKVHWIPVKYSNHMSFSSRIFAFLKFAILSTKISLSVKSDIVFATSTPLTIAVPAIIYSKIKKVPYVFEVRDLWPELPIAMKAISNPISIWLAKLLERVAYANASAIVALSPGMMEGIVSKNYPQNRVCIIPNCCDLDKFKVDSKKSIKFAENYRYTKNKKVVIYAGTLGLINGVESLVMIAKELERISKDICFMIVGDGSEKIKTIELAKKLSIYNKNIFFENPLNKNEIPKLFSIADASTSLFVDKPEMRANSANKFFDALAASKPLIINYGGWHHDLIIEKKNGISIWNMDYKEAALKINEMLGDSDFMKEARINSFKLAKTFNRDTSAEVLEIVLKSVIGKDNKDISKLSL